MKKLIFIFITLICCNTYAKLTEIVIDNQTEETQMLSTSLAPANNVSIPQSSSYPLSLSEKVARRIDINITVDTGILSNNLEDVCTINVLKGADGKLRIYQGNIVNKKADQYLCRPVNRGTGVMIEYTPAWLEAKKQRETDAATAELVNIAFEICTTAIVGF